VFAEQPAQPVEQFQYIRLSTGEDKGEYRSLDVAIATFVSADKQRQLQVDLVGALHVAERSYYDELNRRFRNYEAVLYELVAPEGTRVPRGGMESDSAISMLQGGMTTALGLTYQLDEIDYTRPNLLHADMTPEEFANSMRERDESVGKMVFRAIGQAIAKQSAEPARNTDLRVVAAMLSEDREHALKVVLAEQFADLDGVMTVYEGKHGSTLVTERNKKALTVLKQQIDQGQKRLAIFYGAGHMRDMEQRLTEQFGLVRKNVDWLSAWNLQAKDKKANETSRRTGAITAE
jgi:hypothetical protein